MVCSIILDPKDNNLNIFGGTKNKHPFFGGHPMTNFKLLSNINMLVMHACEVEIILTH
jgi:hypothetical protein